MSTASLHAEAGIREWAPGAGRLPWFGRMFDGTIETPVLTLAVASIPISIAATESFLVFALAVRLFRLWRGQTRLQVPRLFWSWLLLAATEIFVWCFSPSLHDGWGEIRHLLLIGSLFLVLPALNRVSSCVTAWQALFLGCSVSSVFLIGDFISRSHYYRREIVAGGDVSFYLRTGGLLNNWMVYGTVEVLVFAGLLSFWFAYPERRSRWWPVLALNGIAIVVSLTRTLWLAAFLILVFQLLRKRSRWLLALPFFLAGIYFLAPGAIRSRLKVSLNPDYFSNAERIQMLQVGWRMVHKHPWIGVGPGRVESLYLSYLDPSDPVPKYHGHLHNNLAQMAAQFGVPVTLAAIFFGLVLLRELWVAARSAKSREQGFLCQAALFSLFGFVVAGCFDYTYGHSLDLILLAFAVMSVLGTKSGAPPRSAFVCDHSSPNDPRQW